MRRAKRRETRASGASGGRLDLVALPALFPEFVQVRRPAVRALEHQHVVESVEELTLVDRQLDQDRDEQEESPEGLPASIEEEIDELVEAATEPPVPGHFHFILHHFLPGWTCKI